MLSAFGFMMLMSQSVELRRRSSIRDGRSLRSNEVELTQLRRLYETLQLEIIDVLESLTILKESPDFELCQISEKKPGVLDELAAERKKLLEKETADLEKQASQLAEEIKELTGEEPTRIS